MDYVKHYQNLINKAKNRVLDCETYVESHHIVPLCLDGPDNIDNLVNLTPEEHYVAHQLLVKMNPGNKKLITAALFMASHPSGKRNNNKIFGWLRKKHSDYMKNRVVGDETRKKMSDNGKK